MSGKSEQSVLSVGEFLDLINGMIGGESAFVQGEVTGAHPHQTGFYFSLKDPSAGSGQASIMDCYMSPYAYRGLGIDVQDGMEAKVGGLPNIYKPKGRFSFRVETLELAGEGSLKKAYDLLKKKLEGEGLFARKRPLPEFIRRVGIITSRTGAVIDDFRKNLAPLGLELYLKDVRVEGARAVDNITGAVKLFNAKMPDLDVLVIIRGGGSLEDLQAFNNEHVARAIFASQIPTICGIGHDRDVPIACLVGDTATSTPTAAAVLVNQSWNRLAQSLPQYQRELDYGFRHLLSDAISRVDTGGIAAAFQHALDGLKQKISGYETYLSGASPERNLKLGYSIITDSSGQVLKDAGQLKAGDTVSARLAKGEFTSEVKMVT